MATNGTVLPARPHQLSVRQEIGSPRLACRDAEGRDKKLLYGPHCRFMRGRVIRDLRALLDAWVVEIVGLACLGIQDRAISTLL